MPIQSPSTFNDYRAHTEPRLGLRVSESLSSGEATFPGLLLMAILTTRRGRRYIQVPSAPSLIPDYATFNKKHSSFASVTAMTSIWQNLGGLELLQARRRGKTRSRTTSGWIQDLMQQFKERFILNIHTLQSYLWWIPRKFLSKIQLISRDALSTKEINLSTLKIPLNNFDIQLLTFSDCTIFN